MAVVTDSAIGAAAGHLAAHFAAAEIRHFPAGQFQEARSWIGSGGYFFGQALETLLGKIRRYELTVMAVLVGVGVVFWAARFWRVRRTAADQR